MSRNALRLAVLILGGILLTLVVAALLIVGEQGPGLAARRLGVSLILGAGLLAPALARRTTLADVAWEGGALLLATLGFYLLAAVSGLSGSDAWAAALVPGAALALCWSLTLPLRGIGLRATATVAFLGLMAVLMGTPYLIAPNAGRMPAWTLEWNPLVRLHGQLAGEDWLRGPLLYRHSGTRYFDYPRTWAGFELPFLVAGIGLLLGLGLLWARCARARRQQPG